MQQVFGVPLALMLSPAQVNIQFSSRPTKKAFQNSGCSTLAPELEKAEPCT